MHPNEALLRNLYSAMERADGRALAQPLGPDSRWVIPGRSPVAGVYTGPDEIFALWKNVARLTGGGLRLEVRDVLANADRGVVLLDVHGSRNGRELHTRQVAVYELSDGKVLTATFIYEDPYQYEEFWADGGH